MYWLIWERKANTTIKVMLNGHQVDFNAAENAMDDDIRESLHRAFEPGQEKEFLDAYAIIHAARFNGEVFKI